MNYFTDSQVATSDVLQSSANWGQPVIITLLLLMQAAPDQIEDVYPPDPVCDAVDTVGMIECNKHDLAVWDARLNDEYQKALARVGPVSREKLRQAQRLWLQYRDANCVVYEGHGGTIHFVLGGGCIIRMTKERTLELRNFDTEFE